jgi:hypothetical protein
MSATPLWLNTQAYRVDANRLSKMVDILPGKKDGYLEPLDNGTGVKIVAGTRIALQGDDSIWRGYEFATDTEITASYLDAGTAFELGKDYYVYLSQDGVCFNAS